MHKRVEGLWSLVFLLPLLLTGCTSPAEGPRDCAVSREPVTISQAGRICDSIGFCWANPWPQGNDLRGVWVSPAADFWAVGDAGTILHFDGQIWSLSANLPEVSLYGIWGSSDFDIWTVGSGGAIYHYDGRSWMAIPSGVRTTLHGIWGFSSTDIWAVGEAGVALHFDGTTWNTVSVGTTKALLAVWGATPSDLWIGGTHATLLHGDGQRFEQMTSQDHPDVEWSYYSGFWGSRPDDVWVVGGDWQVGSAVHWDGHRLGGNGPTEFATLVEAPQSIWGSGQSDVIVVGERASYRFDGHAWTELARGARSSLRAVTGLANGDAWAVGDGGEIAYLRGCQWTPIWRNQLPDYVATVWAASDDDVWAFGSGAFHFDGHSWTSTDVGVSAPLYAAWGSGPRDIWASGALGKLVHWNGSFWTPFQASTTAPIRVIWGSSPSDVYAVDEITSQMLHWDGLTWSALRDAPPGVIRSLWGSSLTDIWATGPSDVFHHDGKSWSRVVVPEFGGGVWGRSADDVWFFGATGVTHYDGRSFKIHRPGFALYMDEAWGPSQTDMWFRSSRGFISHFDGSNWVNLPTGNTVDFHTLTGAGHTTWASGWSAVGSLHNAVLYRRP